MNYCRTSNCLSAPVINGYCARCYEEVTGAPYPPVPWRKIFRILADGVLMLLAAWILTILVCML